MERDQCRRTAPGHEQSQSVCGRCQNNCLHAEIVEVEIEVVSLSIVPSGNFAELNRTVTCMVLKANDRRTSCPCHDEFRGPRSDYVRQMGDKIIRTPVKEEKSFINRELDPPLTELQTVCDVGWTHRGHEQLVMEYEAILRGERSLMPKS
ncbi:hypothetical protein TNCV_2935941 [Trichonephila clavipes]|nr:hypothetical protein TNCV_2935941 [Trichonephila clavipes]